MIMQIQFETMQKKLSKNSYGSVITLFISFSNITCCSSPLESCTLSRRTHHASPKWNGVKVESYDEAKSEMELVRYIHEEESLYRKER